MDNQTYESDYYEIEFPIPPSPTPEPNTPQTHPSNQTTNPVVCLATDAPNSKDIDKLTDKLTNRITEEMVSNQEIKAQTSTISKTNLSHRIIEVLKILNGKRYPDTPGKFCSKLYQLGHENKAQLGPYDPNNKDHVNNNIMPHITYQQLIGMGFTPDENKEINISDHVPPYYGKNTKTRKLWHLEMTKTPQNKEGFKTLALESQYRKMEEALVGIKSLMTHGHESPTIDITQEEEDNWFEIHQTFALIHTLDDYICDRIERQGYVDLKNTQWEQFWSLVDKLTWKLHGSNLGKQESPLADEHGLTSILRKEAEQTYSNNITKTKDTTKPDLTQIKNINENISPVTDITEEDITALIHTEQQKRMPPKKKQSSKSDCTLDIDNLTDKLSEETRINTALKDQIRILSENQAKTQTPNPEGTQTAQLTEVMNKMSDLIHQTIKASKQESDDEKQTRLLIEQNHLDQQLRLTEQNKEQRKYLLQARPPAIEYPKLRDSNDNQAFYTWTANMTKTMKDNPAFTKENAYYIIMNKSLIPPKLKDLLIGCKTYDEIMKVLSLNFPRISTDKERLLQIIKGTGPLEFEDWDEMMTRIREVIRNLSVLCVNYVDAVISQNDIKMSIISIYPKKDLLGEATRKVNEMIDKTDKLEDEKLSKVVLLDIMRGRLTEIMTMQDYAETLQPHHSTTINSISTNEDNQKPKQQRKPYKKQTNIQEENKDEQQKIPYKQNNNNNTVPNKNTQSLTNSRRSPANPHKEYRKPPYQRNNSPPHNNNSNYTTIANTNTQPTTPKNKNTKTYQNDRTPWKQDQRTNLTNITRCVYCQKQGHKVMNCFLLIEYTQGKKAFLSGKCKICLQQLNNKCRAKECHIVQYTRNGATQTNDLRCPQHNEVSYLACNNSRCRQQNEEKREKALQRRQERTNTPARKTTTFANSIRVSSIPTKVQTNIINNTNTKISRYATNAKNNTKYQNEQPNNSEKTLTQPCMAVEKVTLINRHGREQDLILMYDTGATDALSFGCHNLTTKNTTKEYLQVQTATGTECGWRNILQIDFNLKTNKHRIPNHPIRTLDMTFPLPKITPSIPKDLQIHYKNQLASLPTGKDFDILPGILLSAKQGHLQPEIKKPPLNILRKYPKLRICTSAITGGKMLFGTFEPILNYKQSNNKDNIRPLMETIITENQIEYNPLAMLTNSIRNEQLEKDFKEANYLNNIITTTQYTKPSCLKDQELSQALEGIEMDF